MERDGADWSRREQVWIDLSDLFLDSETADILPGLERRLRASGYDAATLDMIVTEEVAPVVIWNLSAPAGAWLGAPFDEAWLVQEIARRRARRAWLPSLRCWWRRRMLAARVPEWAALRDRLARDA
ncbi:MAG: hypothetical protein AAF919_02405 [Pseudomonadota bacterium]